MEARFARSLIDGESILEDYPFLARFRWLTHREWFCQGSRKVRAAFVGSGHLPISAVCYASYGAKRRNMHRKM